MRVGVEKEIECTHCGQSCIDEAIVDGEDFFCCSGCFSVHRLLEQHETHKKEDHFNIEGPVLEDYAYLEEEDVIDSLTSHREGNWAVVYFYIPNIHCSSCIYLLENIMRLHRGITACRVDFLEKQATFTYDEEEISLRQLVELLTAIDYPPRLQYEQLESKDRPTWDKSLLLKMGVAGFCFGNIMLLSFPDYIGQVESNYAYWFGLISIAFAIPVVFYSAWDYLKSATLSLRSGRLNIDVPVTLGIMTLFLRSTYEITSGVGSGYLDSLSGFVFFLLIGRWFQNITYRSMAFDRDYKSYFPIAVMKAKGRSWLSTSIRNVTVGDRLLIRSGELIPADGRLLRGEGRIDYSFVTGEAQPIRKGLDDKVLAGGRQRGDSIEVEVTESVDQSYLTRLWDKDPFHIPRQNRLQLLLDQIGKYFTFGILLISGLTLLYWWPRDLSVAIMSATAVLIIACPCAIALATPFTYGNIVRILGRRGLFLRNVKTLTQLQDITQVVFDKTGTLTDPEKTQIEYQGQALSEKQQEALAILTLQSSHPMSRVLHKHLSKSSKSEECKDFREIPGSGLSGRCLGLKIKLGSAEFVLGAAAEESGVWIEIEGEYHGVYRFQPTLRPGTKETIEALSKHYPLRILSGDGPQERSRMEEIFPAGATFHFHQSPADKLQHIRSLQDQGEKVLFIGDGLNDAGALRQADVGVVVSDSTQQFSPSSDAILDAGQWANFSQFLGFVMQSRKLLNGAFVFAALYNTIGLFFAVQGLLSPVVAAILMPLSSISVIALGFLGAYIMAYRRGWALFSG
jgi:Cu+-exporting ATPase